MTDSEHLAPTDDAVRTMLEARAARAPVEFLDLATVVASAGRRSSRRGAVLELTPRLSLLATTAAALLVATLLVAIPIANRTAGSAIPSGASDPSSSAQRPPVSTPFAFPRVLSPSELGDLIRTRGEELSGSLVAVRGRLVYPLPCPGCEPLMFDGTNLGYGLRPPPVSTTWGADHVDTGVDRTYVVRIAPELVLRGTVLDLTGELDTGRTQGLTITVAELLKGGIGAGGLLVAVDGWLVRAPLHPCPGVPVRSVSPSDPPTYGCPDDDYLTDLDFQPMQPDGSSVGVSDGILLPAGTYDRWAPSPASFGRDGVGVAPRRATFLLQLPGGACTSTNCTTHPDRAHWVVVGRLDPIWDPAPSESSEPTATAAVGDRYPGGIPRSIAGETVFTGLDTKRNWQ